MILYQVLDSAYQPPSREIYVSNVIMLLLLASTPYPEAGHHMPPLSNNLPHFIAL